MAGRSDLPDDSIPDWVFLDNMLFRKDLSSFGTDDARVTSATALASNGDPVNVSFVLNAVPDTSRVYLHCLEGRCLASIDGVAAAHGGAVLLRLEGGFEGLLSTARAIDYFLYRACPSSVPRLSLLPRCYSTQSERAAAPAGSWRTRPWLMTDFRSIGLLLTDGSDSGGFVVAQLSVDMAKFDDAAAVDAPLEAELYRHRSSSAAAADHGDWEVMRTKARDAGGKATYGGLYGSWDVHRVVPYAGYLCWVDYNRGIIFCDVDHASPELQYLALPVDHVPIGDPYCSKLGSLKACRAVCITKGGEMRVFALMHGSDGGGDMEWKDEATIEAAELWATEGYGDQLPRIVPEFPVVSMDDPGIMYFVLRERHCPAEKTWVVTLDMDSMVVVSYKDIEGVPREDDDDLPASYNIFCGRPFFPSEFSKYLS
ncbi:hypothetical protein ACP4OV_021318 [Aristida adscensionis]